MGKILKDEKTRQEWFAMPIELQISNIGSEVLRADRQKKRHNDKLMRSFYNAAIDFLVLSMHDPKNINRRSELGLCIDELADYFMGDNRWGTTSQTLERYYNQFMDQV